MRESHCRQRAWSMPPRQTGGSCCASTAGAAARVVFVGRWRGWFDSGGWQLGCQHDFRWEGQAFLQCCAALRHTGRAWLSGLSCVGSQSLSTWRCTCKSLQLKPPKCPLRCRAELAFKSMSGSERPVDSKCVCRDGCHHCGTRRNAGVIGDHMPPNKLVKVGGGLKQDSFLSCRVPGKAVCELAMAQAVSVTCRTLHRSMQGQWKLSCH